MNDLRAVKNKSIQIMEKDSKEVKDKNSSFGGLINTLKKWLPSEEYSECKNNYLFETNIEMYDSTSSYNIGIFKRNLKCHKVFDNLEVAIKTLSDGISKCCRYIDKTVPMVVCKDATNPFVFIKWSEFKRENKMYCKYMSGDSSKDEIKKLWIFTPLEIDKRLSFVDYGFFPNIDKCPEYVFNTWPGFEYEKNMKDFKSEKLSCESKKFLNHIFEVWANYDNNKYSYILNWISFILQNPGKKTKVALVLSSAQGAGKGCIIDFLFEELFGFQVCEQVVSLSRLTSHFNADLENKLLLWIDEIGVEKNNFCVSWERLKSYITDPLIKIEKKRVDQSMKPNYLNLILTTNNLSNLKVESGDRRYSIFKCNDKYCKDSDYWNSFYEILNGSKVRKRRIACEIANFLINRKQIQNVGHFITEEHKNLVEESKPIYQIFIEQVKSREYIITDERGKPMEEIKASELFNEFHIWCSENNFKQNVSICLFGRKIKELGIETKRTKNGIKYII